MLPRRCVLESSASSELLARLKVYPKMWAALEVLPPKVLALSSSEPSKPVELLVEGLETRVSEWRRRGLSSRDEATGNYSYPRTW